MIVDVAKVIKFLSLFCLFLIGVSTLGSISTYFFGHDNIYGFVRLFNLDSEQNVPTLFSVLLILCISMLLCTISIYEKKEDSNWSMKWRVLSAIFLYIAVDEFSSLHELLIRPLRSFFHTGAAGIFYFAWVIPGLAVVAFLAVYFLKFLLCLPRFTRAIFILSAVLYVGGALGVELLGGSYAEAHGLFNFQYSMITTIEESLEMSGLIVFIYALLNYMRARSYDLHIDII